MNETRDPRSAAVRSMPGAETTEPDSRIWPAADRPSPTQEAEDGKAERRLAGAGFAYEAQDLAASDGQVDAPQDVAGRRGDAQALDREQGLGRLLGGGRAGRSGVGLHPGALPVVRRIRRQRGHVADAWTVDHLRA